MDVRKKARVVAVFGDRYKVTCDLDELTVKLKGKFYYNNESANLPCVGDWVYIEDEIIDEIIERKNYLSRKVAGKQQKEQIFATNIDYAFIVTSLNKEFNIKRIERYYMMVKLSNITPIIILTKKDLCDNTTKYIEEIDKAFGDLKIIVTSSVNMEGIEQIEEMLKDDLTGIFIGSSGVGKSTLVNNIIGADLQLTQKIRNDDKGKHTTTHRELFVLPNGGSIVDSPGIREIQFLTSEVSVEDVFDDILTLSYNCRFKNCNHMSEPDCAVKKAIEDGIIEADRLKRYNKYKSLVNKPDRAQYFADKSKRKKQSKNERYSRKK